MTKTSEEALIAILIEKLGGEVIVTREDFYRADELEVTRWDRPASMDYKLTAKRPPEILAGEIVTAEPQSIEPFYAVEWTPAPPACRHCRTVH